MADEAVTVELRWRGSVYRDRGNEVARKALKEIADQAAEEMQMLVKVVTGTTQRSVHVAPRGYDGGGQIREGGSDAGRAYGGEDLQRTFSDQMGDLAPTQGLDVGSWVPWAEKVDELISPFVTPAGEHAEERWIEACTRGFRESGLND